jgi:hypothetical protein
VLFQLKNHQVPLPHPVYVSDRQGGGDLEYPSLTLRLARNQEARKSPFPAIEELTSGKNETFGVFW